VAERIIKTNMESIIMNTAELTIQLPEKEIRFLEKYAEYQGISISELINRYVKGLQVSQKFRIHPDILKITGIIPQQIDVETEFLKHSIETV